jgi:hypothetical protein
MASIMNKHNSKFKYLFHKAVSYLLPDSFFGTKITPGLIQIKLAKNPKKVIFVLDDPLYIHLGDQLFCAPIIIALQKAGFPVEVALPGDMPAFWKCNNIVATDFNNLSFEDSYCFTYLPMIFSRGLRNKPGFAIALNDVSIPNRISPYLCRKIYQLLNVKLDSVPELALPCSLNSDLEQQILSLGDSVWLMNDLLVSGFYRWTTKKRRIIWEKAQEIAQKGGKIIYLKGEREIQLPHLLPSVISLDLRGKTSPDDVMGIMQLPNIKGIISFDNYLMHVALLCKKQAFVLFRGRFSRKQRQHCFKKVNTAFAEVDGSNITYL